MKHIKKFGELTESFWSDTFGNPTVKDAAHDALRGQGHSHTKKDDTGAQAIVFNGQEFYPDQIQYADYGDLGEIPRIENDKLIVANPAWSM
jgi:hypothetical protein